MKGVEWMITYISIKLPDKAGEVAVFEEGGKQISGELRWLPHHKRRPVAVPGDDTVGGRIFYQHIGLE